MTQTTTTTASEAAYARVSQARIGCFLKDDDYVRALRRNVQMWLDAIDRELATRALLDARALEAETESYRPDPPKKETTR